MFVAFCIITGTRSKGHPTGKYGWTEVTQKHYFTNYYERQIERVELCHQACKQQAPFHGLSRRQRACFNWLYPTSRRWYGLHFSWTASFKSFIVSGQRHAYLSAKDEQDHFRFGDSGERNQKGRAPYRLQVGSYGNISWISRCHRRGCKKGNRTRRRQILSGLVNDKGQHHSWHHFHNKEIVCTGCFRPRKITYRGQSQCPE